MRKPEHCLAGVILMLLRRISSCPIMTACAMCHKHGTDMVFFYAVGL